MVRMWRKMSASTLLMGMQISETGMERSMEVSEKTKNSFVTLKYNLVIFCTDI
jgi:hypothetical protein